MVITKEDIAYWTARVAELERQLDAATKLSEIKAIAGELHRTRAALKEAESKTVRAGQRSTREKSRQSGRRSASNEAGLATS
jgi:hypothetical protein